MSTIDPSTIDPTKPAQGEASTANVRANEAATQANFTAAKNDIEALETGKADQASLDAHIGAGGAEHPDATGSVSGFMSATDKTKLDGIVPGASGTLRTVQEEGAQVTDGDSTLDFRATGDASVSVSSQAGNVTRITIDATAGGGGGGIGKGTPFVVGGILEVTSNAGDGQAATHAAGLTAAEVRSHLDITAGNPHGTTAADVGALANVVEDTTPQLGGDLDFNQNKAVITNATDQDVGLLGPVGSNDGIYLARVQDGGAYDPNDGGIAAYPGVLELHGGAVAVVGLKHGEDSGRQVYVSEGGVLYGVNPPEPGWEVSDNDPGSYDLGTGTGVGAWVEMTGLQVNPVQDITAGDRFDLSANLFVSNKTTNRSGTIEVGYGVDGVAPTGAGNVHPVSPGMEAYISTAWQGVSASDVTTAQRVNVFARRTFGDNAQFGVDLEGTPNNHALFLSTPSEGGGGSGDVTGPGSSTDTHLASFDGATGKVIQDSGIPSVEVQRRISGGTNMNLVSRDSSGDIQDSGIGSSTVTGHIGTAGIHVDHNSTLVSAGDGLTGGGSIAANRTLNVGAGSGIIVNANDVALDFDSVTYQASQAQTGNYTISLDGSPREDLTGPITVTAPISGDGSKEIVVISGAITLSGFTVLGAAGTTPQAAYVSRIGSTSYWVWGQDSS